VNATLRGGLDRCAAIWHGGNSRPARICRRVGARVLRAAALLGTDFAVPDLAIVLGRSVADLIPPVDEACAAGVLAESGHGLGFRVARYDEMLAPVRAAWRKPACG